MLCDETLHKTVFKILCILFTHVCMNIFACVGVYTSMWKLEHIRSLVH